MPQREYSTLFLRPVKGPGINGGSAVGGGGGILLATARHRLDGQEHIEATDNVRLDASTDHHGLLPKLSGDSDEVLRGDGTFGPPPPAVATGVDITLTNKSGGSVAAGDVVVISTGNDTAFTTTTTGQAEVSVGVAQETIANNASGKIRVSGYVTLINVPASVTRGHYIETHTAVKQATGNATRRAGSFGQFAVGGTTPQGWLWGGTDQTASGGFSDPMTTRGDIIVRNASNVTARLGVGSANKFLHSDGTDPSWQQVVEADLNLTDVTTANASTSQHGFLKKLPGGTTTFLRGDGTFASPSGGGGGSLIYPLDNYVNAFVSGRGDDFTTATLSGGGFTWTRRGFTTETLQQGYNATWAKINTNGRTGGDGYFTPATSGDWTLAAKFIMRGSTQSWGIGVVDTNGTGVWGMAEYSAHSPWASILIAVTTYTTYGGSYVEALATGASPNISNFAHDWIDSAWWVKLRKSGTSYFWAYSRDGEMWSPEGSGLTWAGTVDRWCFGFAPLGGSVAAYTEVNMDWIGQIA